MNDLAPMPYFITIPDSKTTFVPDYLELISGWIRTHTKVIPVKKK